MRKLVLCSGKVYYDLIAERSRRAIDDIAIGRLEQISPFPHDYLQAFNAAHSRHTTGTTLSKFRIVPCCRKRQKNTRTLRSFGAKRSRRMPALGPTLIHVFRLQCELLER